MERVRFNRNDLIFIIICLLVLIGGTLFGVKNFKRAFPEAAIEFNYTKDEAGDIASNFLADINNNPRDDARHASAFSYSGLAKTYLEKELGLAKAQEYFGNPVRLWYWNHRWFTPGEKEEVSVHVTPSGEVVYYNHQIEEEAEGADLPEDSARVIAESILFDVMKVDINKVEFFESAHKGWDNRGDWTFTWKVLDFEPVEGSNYRYDIKIQGDQFGMYNEYLHVPELWKADYNKMRSYNEATGMTATLFMLLTWIALGAIFIHNVIKRDIQWKTGMVFGIIAAVLVYANMLNQLPLTLIGYVTTTSWSGFLMENILLGLLQALGTGILIMLLTLGAEVIFRKHYPHMASLPRMFTVRGLRTKSAFKNILLGITLTAFFFAYQVIFYMIADHFGGWSPADVPYSNLLNTAMPWLAVLLIGFMPAVSEEFTSRMFSIPFLDRVFKGKARWLAVIISAMIWGFAHAGYPNQPFWIRGVEVGIGGIIVGIVMLRWGILAPLVWHYTVDAFYTAMLMFRSENPYFITTAAVATGLLVIPLLAALIAYIKTGTFLPESGVLNEDIKSPDPETVTEEKDELDKAADFVEGASEEKEEVIAETVTPEEKESADNAKRFTNGGRIAIIAVFVVGVLLAFIPQEKPFDFINYSFSADKAEQLFADSLRARGFCDPDTMKLMTYVPDQLEFSKSDWRTYLFKNSKSISDFNELFDKTLMTNRWVVYAYQPENRLRFYGAVNSTTGKVASVLPVLPEEMALDSLSKDSAQVIAENLMTLRGYNLDEFVLKDYKEKRHPNRLDHTFTWEAKEGDPRHVGEAKFRHSVSFKGNWESISSTPYHHIPEDWTRDRKAKTAARTVLMISTIFVIAGIIAWMITLLILRSIKKKVNWRRASVLAIIPAVLTFTNAPNISYEAMRAYFWQISTPLQVFSLMVIISSLIASIFLYLMFFCVIALMSSLYSEKLEYLSRSNRSKVYLDAIIAVLGAVGLALVLDWIKTALIAWKPEFAVLAKVPIPGYLNEPFPLGAVITSAISEFFRLTALLGFLAYIWKRFHGKIWVQVLLFIGFVMITMSRNAIEPGEFLMTLAYNIVYVTIIFLFMRFVIAGRYIQFIAFVFGFVVFKQVSSGLGIGSTEASIVSAVFLMISLLVLSWWLGKPQKN